jgi:hypothetical protein
MKLPQLSLRDLFWLMLVAGCLCGWFGDCGYLRQRIVELEQRLDWKEAINAVATVTSKTGGFVATDRETDP